MIYLSYMMGYYGGWGLMPGAWIFCSITWLVVIVDLALVGVWLWKQITKK